jgi:hypothetical protein
MYLLYIAYCMFLGGGHSRCFDAFSFERVCCLLVLNWFLLQKPRHCRFFELWCFDAAHSSCHNFLERKRVTRVPCLSVCWCTRSDVEPQMWEREFVCVCVCVCVYTRSGVEQQVDPGAWHRSTAPSHECGYHIRARAHTYTHTLWKKKSVKYFVIKHEKKKHLRSSSRSTISVALWTNQSVIYYWINENK